MAIPVSNSNVVKLDKNTTTQYESLICEYSISEFIYHNSSQISVVENLKSEVVRRSGLANPNRFRAMINVPDYVREGGKFDMRSLDLLCESISFPGKQIETLDYSMYRNPLKIPTGYINDDITISFRLTEEFYATGVPLPEEIMVEYTSTEGD